MSPNSSGRTEQAASGTHRRLGRARKEEAPGAFRLVYVVAEDEAGVSEVLRFRTPLEAIRYIERTTDDAGRPSRLRRLTVCDRGACFSRVHTLHGWKDVDDGR